MNDLLQDVTKYAESRGWTHAEAGAYYRHGTEKLLTLGIWSQSGNLFVGLMENETAQWPGEQLYHGKNSEAAKQAIERVSPANNNFIPMPEKFGDHPHDMAQGPCACGATHRLNDWPEDAQNLIRAEIASRPA